MLASTPIKPTNTQQHQITYRKSRANARLSAAGSDHLNMATEITNSTNSLDALLEQLSVDSDERGKLFEKVTKWFLKTDPTFASELREVWSWDDWPAI